MINILKIIWKVLFFLFNFFKLRDDGKKKPLNLIEEWRGFVN